MGHSGPTDVSSTKEAQRTTTKWAALVLNSGGSRSGVVNSRLLRPRRPPALTLLGSAEILSVGHPCCASAQENREGAVIRPGCD